MAAVLPCDRSCRLLGRGVATGVTRRVLVGRKSHISNGARILPLLTAAWSGRESRRNRPTPDRSDEALVAALRRWPKAQGLIGRNLAVGASSRSHASSS